MGKAKESWEEIIAIVGRRSSLTLHRFLLANKRERREKIVGGIHNQLSNCEAVCIHSLPTILAKEIER